MNLNNTPSSYYQTEDTCSYCRSTCNRDTDIDNASRCNNCRDKSNINMILAMSENLTIGNDNRLPWNLPSDLKMFKEKTLGSIIFMGRKCYESIGRPLPKRENVILTNNVELVIPGCIVVNSIQEFISKYKNDTREIFIIGGAKLYEQTFEITNKLYLTIIQGYVAGDVKISGLNFDKWELSSDGKVQYENGNAFKFLEFIKKK
jgi:dihydrofolate reductase